MAGSLKYYAEQNAIIWFVPNLTREKGEIPQAAFRGIFIPEQVVHEILVTFNPCLLYTSPSPRDRTRSRMPSSA